MDSIPLFFSGMESIPTPQMPFSTKVKQRAYDQLRYQRQKEMATNQALGLIKDVKKNYKRGISAGTTANEMLEEFGTTYRNEAIHYEMSKLSRELIPNEPMDDIEELYLTLDKAGRVAEFERLAQKIRFLETMDLNDDIRANQFIGSVLLEMDAKAKAKEADEASRKSRKNLGKSTKSTDQATTGTESIEPQPVASVWGSFFGSAKRPRSSPR